MQRDMTPKEIHKTDLEYHFSDRKLDYTENDRRIVFYDPANPICKKYPNLTFLLGWHKIKHMRTEIISAYEQYLTHVINADDSKTPLPSNDPCIQTTKQWYLGLLDPHFHYRHTNDQRFIEHMQEQTWMLKKEDTL